MREDGGSAFPTTVHSLADGLPAMTAPGMSLRDWFAGMAMMGFMANTKRPTTIAPDDADWAYTIADALLKARGVE